MTGIQNIVNTGLCISYEARDFTFINNLNKWIIEKKDVRANTHTIQLLLGVIVKTTAFKDDIARNRNLNSNKLEFKKLYYKEDINNNTYEIFEKNFSVSPNPSYMTFEWNYNNLRRRENAIHANDAESLYSDTFWKDQAHINLVFFSAVDLFLLLLNARKLIFSRSKIEYKLGALDVIRDNVMRTHGLTTEEDLMAHFKSIAYSPSDFVEMYSYHTLKAEGEYSNTDIPGKLPRNSVTNKYVPNIAIGAPCPTLWGGREISKSYMTYLADIDKIKKWMRKFSKSKPKLSKNLSSLLKLISVNKISKSIDIYFDENELGAKLSNSRGK